MNKEKGRQDFAALFNKWGIYIILLLMMVLSAIASPNFLTVSNILSVLRQSTPTILLAFGAMFLMISGNMDLSVGAGLAFSGIAALEVYTKSGNLMLGVAFGIFCGIVKGVVNGVIKAYLGVPSFIVTLAMDMIIRGLIMIYTNGQAITRTDNFAEIGQGYVGPIPIPIIIVAVTAVVAWFILRNTTMGRKFYAIGGNAEAAKAACINVKRVIVQSYIVSGVLTAMAGIILISRLNSGAPNAGDGYALDAIASTVIGGSSLAGGVGTATGTLVGAVIMGLISNILNLVGVQSYVQKVVKGLIILAAVILDVQSKKKKS